MLRLVLLLIVAVFSPACIAQNEYYVRFDTPEAARAVGAWQPDIMPDGVWNWWHLDRPTPIRTVVAGSLGLPVADVQSVGTGMVTRAETIYPISGEWSLQNPWDPNDPFYPLQWGQTDVQGNTTRWWTNGNVLRTVRVVVLDSGVTNLHPDLTRVVDGWSLIDGKTPYDDECNHGTRVGGIICANTNNNLGVASTSSSVELYSVKVLDGCSGSLADVVDGAVIGMAVFHADVMNVSLQWRGIYAPWQEAMDLARELGTIMVVATGNQGSSTPSGAAMHDWIIKVGATDINRVPASWSNRGADVYAPGVVILSTSFSGPIGGPYSPAYESGSGTSFAAPHVAAALSGMISVMPGYVRDGAVAKEIVEDFLASGDEGYLEAPHLNAARAVLMYIPCIADWDEDGDIDTFDFLFYADSFARGDPRADLNPDHVFDIFDFLEFQSAYVNAIGTGCVG